LELRGDGMTMAEIAAFAGISAGKVRYVLSPQWGEP
jgi:DNA-binding CsgD family transcriptional regulator